VSGLIQEDKSLGFGFEVDSLSTALIQQLYHMTEIKKTDPTLIYELEEIVGKGCFGRVHRARNKLTNQEVAIKIIDTNSQEDGIQNIVREIEILTTCNHENIVRYYESFRKGEELWVKQQTLHTNEQKESNNDVGILSIFLKFCCCISYLICFSDLRYCLK
jgi:serine/threonine protein kinase